MKKAYISQALLGLNLGFILCSFNGTENMPKDMQTFYEQLNPDAQKKFLELDATHRQKAMSIVEQHCKGNDECKGHREQAVLQQYKHQMQEKRLRLQAPEK